MATSLPARLRSPDVVDACLTAWFDASLDENARLDAVKSKLSAEERTEFGKRGARLCRDYGLPVFGAEGGGALTLVSDLDAASDAHRLCELHAHLKGMGSDGFWVREVICGHLRRGLSEIVGSSWEHHIRARVDLLYRHCSVLVQ